MSDKLLTMALSDKDLDQVIDLFRSLDILGAGTIESSLFVEALQQLGIASKDVRLMLEGVNVVEGGQVQYEIFFRWLRGGKPVGKAPAVKSKASMQLELIASSLENIASSISAKDAAASATLVGNAEALRLISLTAFQSEPDEFFASITDAHLADVHLIADATPDGALAHLMAPPDDAHDPMLTMMKRHNTTPHQLTEEEKCVRKEAADLMESTGKQGTVVRDIEEVPIKDVKDKLALSYWRFCEGIRCYRSPSVTKALRLICSAHVPGLGDVTYLDCFDKLTSSDWESHIYLFGGLVRDILLRTVGNDIDIGFSAPAAELQKICEKHKYTCMLDGDYILIGEQNAEEYLEGMVISYNGIQPSYHADFSMNTLFYDFKNDIIIDRTGIGIPAIQANRCDLPCPQKQWHDWVAVNGCRVFFRLYKFLLRGYDYDPEEMAYVAGQLLEWWSRDESHTIEVGRIALGKLVGSTKASEIEALQTLVTKSFGLAAKPANNIFQSADAWWQSGWMKLLQLSS